MSGSLVTRIRNSPILGGSDFSAIFKRVSHLERNELVAEMRRILGQKDGNDEFEVPEYVVRYIAMELARQATDTAVRTRPQLLEPGRASSMLIYATTNRKIDTLAAKILPESWVANLTQSRGMQRHFDHILMSMVNPDAGGNIIENTAIENGVAVYNEIADALVKAVRMADFKGSQNRTDQSVQYAFDDFKAAHGYVSLAQILTFYRINETYRFAVLEYCSRLESIGINDGDMDLAEMYSRDDIGGLVSALARVTSIHVFTGTIDVIFRPLFSKMRKLHLYNDISFPLDLIQPTHIEYLYWYVDADLGRDFPEFQTIYYTKLSERYPSKFKYDYKDKDCIKTMFIYRNFYTASNEIRNLPSVDIFKGASLFFMVATIRGTLRSIKPGGTYAERDRSIYLDMVQEMSESFYASVNYNEIMTTDFKIVPVEDSSSSDYSSSDEGEDIADPMVVDTSSPISLRAAYDQVHLMLVHLGMKIPPRLYTMSRTGLVIFIRNILALSPHVKGGVGDEILKNLLNDLYVKERLTPPFSEIDLVMADQLVLDDGTTQAEKLMYNAMTLDDITEIFDRYGKILEVVPGQRQSATVPLEDRMIDDIFGGGDWNMSNAEEQQQGNYDVETFPMGEDAEFGGVPELSFFTGLDSAIHDLIEANARDPQDATDKATLTQMKIQITVLKMIHMNAAYTRQEYPDLVKLLRVMRFSPLFFDTAVTYYLPTITSLVIRANTAGILRLVYEVTNFTSDQWNKIHNALRNVTRIMSMYGDPLVLDHKDLLGGAKIVDTAYESTITAARAKQLSDTLNSRMRELLVRIYEFRAVSYDVTAAANKVKYPKIRSLFMALPGIDPKLRLLVLMTHVSRTIPDMFLYQVNGKRPGPVVAKRGPADDMKDFMKNLTLVVEHRDKSRASFAAAPSSALYRHADIAENYPIPRIAVSLTKVVANIGGLLLFKFKDTPSHVYWPSGDKALPVDVQRSRIRRTLADTVMLHELLIRPIEILSGSLDDRVAEFQNRHTQETLPVALTYDLFDLTMQQRYSEYRYPGPGGTEGATLEFETREQFQNYVRAYSARIPTFEEDGYVTERNESTVASIVSWGTLNPTILNPTLLEIVYISTIILLKYGDTTKFDFANGVVGLFQAYYIGTEGGILGWCFRSMFLPRIPSIAISDNTKLANFPQTENLDRTEEIITTYFGNGIEVIFSHDFISKTIRQFTLNAVECVIRFDAFRIFEFRKRFSPERLRTITIDLRNNKTMAQDVDAVNYILGFFIGGANLDIGDSGDRDLTVYTPNLVSIDFFGEYLNDYELDPRIENLPFVVTFRGKPITLHTAVMEPWQIQRKNKFNVFTRRLETVKNKILRGQDLADSWRIDRDELYDNPVRAIQFPQAQMQDRADTVAQKLDHMRPIHLPEEIEDAVSLTIALDAITVNLVGTDREYAPILYVWTSWGSGRHANRIAASDDDAVTLMSSWSMSLPPLSESAIDGDETVHFSLYARSRESGLESIDKYEADVIERIIPIGRTSITVRDLLLDALTNVDRPKITLEFQEPALNEQLENVAIQSIGVNVSDDQRNSIRDKIMRENATGKFQITLSDPLPGSPEMIARILTKMENSVEQRFKAYISDDSLARVIPPIDEALMEPIYFRAMYPLYMRYVTWFIGTDDAPPRIPPSEEAAKTLHLFLWQTPIGALLPARAFWQCIPQLIPYTSETVRQKELMQFERGEIMKHKQMYFESLLQVSLDIDDISPSSFIDIVTRQLNDTNGARVHEWFMTCAAACVRAAMLAANSVHYTSDFRFSRDGKQHENEYWNVDISSGLGNAADCENSEQFAAMLIRTIIVDIADWSSLLSKAAAHVLKLYAIFDVGAVVTAAYVGPSDPARTGDLPVIGSEGDLASETGGHAHGLCVPLGIVADQMQQGGASENQIRDAIGEVNYPPWHYRLHKMIFEGTGAIFPYILPLKETFAEQPLEYAFHLKKRELSESMVQKLDFSSEFGFGAYRYPFYNETPTENRRVSSFYRLFCHGILAIQALGAPELGKVTFAKPAKTGFAWGVSAGEYLRDGRNGRGTSKMALISSCLDMRDHFIRYTNPFIESFVRQLPLASVGRISENSWVDPTSLYSGTPYDFDGVISHIETPIDCAICPPCHRASRYADSLELDPQSVISAYAVHERQATAKIRGMVRVSSYITDEKLEAIRDLFSLMEKADDFSLLANNFTLTTLRRYALANDEMGAAILDHNIWETLAMSLLGEEGYAISLALRLSYADVMQGASMYFIIFVIDSVRRIRAIGGYIFSPPIKVMTTAFEEREMPVIPSSFDDMGRIATFIGSVANNAIEIYENALPIVGASTRYHESLTNIRPLVTPATVKKFRDEIIENWTDSLPDGGPKLSIDRLNAFTPDGIARVWIFTHARSQWKHKIQPLIEKGIATPYAIMEMTYEEVDDYVIPLDRIPRLRSSLDDDRIAGSPLTKKQRTAIASAAFFNDVYYMSVKLQSVKTTDRQIKDDRMRNELFIDCAVGYGFDSNEEFDIIVDRVMKAPSTSVLYRDILTLTSSMIMSDDVRSRDHTFSSNWGFFNVHLIVKRAKARPGVPKWSMKLPQLYPSMVIEWTVTSTQTALMYVPINASGETMVTTPYLTGPIVYPGSSCDGCMPWTPLTTPLRSPWIQTRTPDPKKISFFAFGWILSSPEHLLKMRQRVDEVSKNDSTFDVFTPLPSTGDRSIRIIVDVADE